MIKTKIMLFVLTAALAGSLTVAGRAEVAPNPDPTPAFSPTVRPKADLGVYDPNQAVDSAANIRYEQIWADWSRDSAASVLVRLQAITAKGRTPILTIDPYALSKIGKEKSLLGDVTAGKYDSVIRDYAAAVKGAGSTVIVRWGPEMERDIDKPWSISRRRIISLPIAISLPLSGLSRRGRRWSGRPSGIRVARRIILGTIMSISSDSLFTSIRSARPNGTERRAPSPIG